MGLVRGLSLRQNWGQARELALKARISERLGIPHNKLVERNLTGLQNLGITAKTALLYYPAITLSNLLEIEERPYFYRSGLAFGRSDAGRITAGTLGGLAVLAGGALGAYAGIKHLIFNVLPGDLSSALLWGGTTAVTLIGLLGYKLIQQKSQTNKLLGEMQMRLGERIKGVETNVAGLKVERDTLQAQLNEVNSKIVALSKQIEELEQKKTELEKAFESSGKENTALSDQLEKAKNQIKDYQAEIDELKKGIKECWKQMMSRMPEQDKGKLIRSLSWEMFWTVDEADLANLFVSSPKDAAELIVNTANHIRKDENIMKRFHNIVSLMLDESILELARELYAKFGLFEKRVTEYDDYDRGNIELVKAICGEEVSKTVEAEADKAPPPKIRSVDFEEPPPEAPPIL